MASDFDPYRILEVDPSAAQTQIDEAFRRQWAAYPNDPAPEERRREIQAAYRILSDPAERRALDERRASAPSVPVAVAEWPSQQQPPETPLDPDVPRWKPGDVGRAIGAVLGITFVAVIVFSLLAALVAGGADEIDNSAAGTTIELIASLFFQGAAFGAVYWFGIRKYGQSWRSLGWRPPEKTQAWLPFALVVMAMTLQTVYGVILSILNVDPDTDLPDAMFENAIPLTLLLITTLAIAPVVEETFFRGFIFGGLRRHWGVIWAGVFSSVLFGLAHSGNPGYLYLLPLVAMLGGLFAWGYYYSRSLYTTIAAHFIFNSIAMIITLATR